MSAQVGLRFMAGAVWPKLKGWLDRVTLYLRDLGKASAFLATFPHLKLPDGTQVATYSNPSRRPG